MSHILWQASECMWEMEGAKGMEEKTKEEEAWANSPSLSSTAHSTAHRPAHADTSNHNCHAPLKESTSDAPTGNSKGTFPEASLSSEVFFPQPQKYFPPSPDNGVVNGRSLSMSMLLGPVVTCHPHAYCGAVSAICPVLICSWILYEPPLPVTMPVT